MEPLYTAATISTALYGERLAVGLGFGTLLFSLATFTTCRSFSGLIRRVTKTNLTDFSWYRRYNSLHGYFWWFFVFIFALHLMAAVMHTAIPKAGDPDAGIHWFILSFGLAALVSTTVTLWSCRSWVSLMGMFTTNNLLQHKMYKTFYSAHAVFWLVLLAAIAGHFISAYIHVGFWPH
jgi:cytochrome b561